MKPIGRIVFFASLLVFQSCVPSGKKNATPSASVTKNAEDLKKIKKIGSVKPVVGKSSTNSKINPISDEFSPVILDGQVIAQWKINDKVRIIKARVFNNKYWVTDSISATDTYFFVRGKNLLERADVVLTNGFSKISIRGFEGPTGYDGLAKPTNFTTPPDYQLGSDRTISSDGTPYYQLIKIIDPNEDPNKVACANNGITLQSVNQVSGLAQVKYVFHATNAAVHKWSLLSNSSVAATGIVTATSSTINFNVPDSVQSGNYTLQVDVQNCIAKDSQKLSYTKPGGGVISAPNISSNPSPAIEGSSVSLSSSNCSYSVDWYKNGNFLSTGSSYTISSAIKNDKYSAKCKSGSTVSTFSNEISIAEKPFIDPGKIACAGNGISLLTANQVSGRSEGQYTFHASNASVHKWSLMLNGSAAVTGTITATSSTINFSIPDSVQSGDYNLQIDVQNCIAKDSRNFNYTKPGSGAISAPSISSNPSPAIEGSSVSLSSSNCSYSVDWYKNGNFLSTGPSYTISSAIKDDKYSAKCKNGSTTSGVSNEISIAPLIDPKKVACAGNLFDILTASQKVDSKQGEYTFNAINASVHKWSLMSGTTVVASDTITATSSRIAFNIPDSVLSGNYTLQVDIQNCSASGTKVFNYLKPNSSLDGENGFVNPSPQNGDSEKPKYCPQPCLALSTLPEFQGQIEIPSDKNYYIDKNINTGNLIIKGGLYCKSNNSYELKVLSILVEGTFECGNEDSPYSGNLVISLKGNSEIKPRTGYQLKDLWNRAPTSQELASERNRTLFYRGFVVQGSNAKLRLNGKNRSIMARLSKAAGPGSTSITLNSNVDWKAGETIGIAPTGYDAFENERIKIKSITKNVVQLEQPLRYSHLGNAIDKFSGQSRDFVLNQSAEVVLLSRNILIQADDPYSQLAPEQEGSDPGGHVMIHYGGKAYINSVEFYKMGQAGIIGRYPFHWHKLGDASGQFISNSSIHYSFQRCITIHGTSSTLIENNVCQDFRGHGLFLEDGDEINNEIKGNIIIGALYPHDTKHILRSDFRGVNTNKDRFPSVSSFWISNPNNSVYNNIAAGSVGTGFWNSFEGDILKINTKRFSDNTAHAALVGITWDGARGNSPIEASISFNNPDDKITDSAHYNPPTTPLFKNLTAYKNAYTGLYFRGQTAIFEENLFADNGWDFFVAFNQILKNSVFARSSFTKPGFIHKSVILYDGPFQIHNTDFYNFRQDFDTNGNIIPGSDIPFEVIGGHEKLTNLTSGLRFLNSVNLKVKMKNSKGDKSPDAGITSNLKDLDGTLVGNNYGAVFVGNYGFGAYLGAQEGCTTSSKFPGFKICPKEMATGTLRVAKFKEDASLVSYIRRSDGIESLTASDFNLMNLPRGDECWFPDHNAPVPSTCGFSGNTKTLLPDPHKYQYEVLLYDQNEKPNTISFQYYTPNGGEVSPIFKIDIKRNGCYVDNANQKLDTNSFKNSNESAYYVEGSVVYFKINASNKFRVIGNSSEVRSNETVGEVILRCP